MTDVLCRNDVIVDASDEYALTDVAPTENETCLYYLCMYTVCIYMYA